jgi:RNA polymerase sigma-70 factor (ECF subfamily)
MVALYAPLVMRWCRTAGLGEADAADVFQEVFQTVATRLGSFRHTDSGDTFRGWLRTITRNKVNDLFRRREHEPPGVGGSEARDWLSQVPQDFASRDVSSAGSEKSELLHRALAMIQSDFEPRTWASFWQTAVEGRGAADVAADLGMTPGAVRVAKSRVLHRLRLDLGDLFG